MIFTSYQDLMASGLQYPLIEIDPPWNFRNWSADAPGMIHNRSRGANKHYPTMTIEDIALMRPPVARNGIVFCWMLSSHVPELCWVADQWRLKIVTKAWTWIKRAKTGRPHIGGGYYVRHATEDCYILTDGKGPGRPARYDVDDVIEAPRGDAHSSKPMESFRRIDLLYPDLWPRLQMYGRSPLPGWSVFGNQIGVCLETP